jgi:hypothetical protein
MSRGLGKVQRAVLGVIEANAAGLAADAIVGRLYGPHPRPAERESVRRALRTLRQRGLIEVTTRQATRTRRSLKRIFDLSGCDPDFCSACARRTRRVRLQDWHRQAMRDLARGDAGWLQDLAVAEASGFVHYAASADRLVSIEPEAVDHHRRRLQFAAPIQPGPAPPDQVIGPD